QGDRISRIASQVNPTGIGDAKGIEINTANLFLTNDAQISSGVLGKGNGGLVLINAAEKLSLNKSTILNNLEADATGKAGDIEITTTNLNLINGSEIEAVTRGIGDAGQISLDVAANISVEGGGIFSNVEGEKSQGNAGGIEIDTANLALTNGADLSASTRGRGNAGAIVINATDTIALNGTNPQGDRISRIASQVNPTGIGDAKGIEINTANLFLTNGAQISGGVVGTGAGGLVSINAADKLSLNSSDILTNLEADATGKAGDIDITTTNLNLTNDSQIAASTRGIGDAGQISLDVGETISAKGGGILSTVAGKNSQGNAGGIEINTKNLSLTNGAQITSGVVGTGTGGLVSINVTDEISLDDGFILTNLEADATGKAGNIEITTTNLNLTNGSEIDAVTRGIGDAGQISLDVAETISVKGRGIFSSVEGENSQGNAGGIEIDTANLSLTNSAVISASTSGRGNAGSIAINATDTIALDGTNPQGDGSSSIVSQVNSSGIGNAGGIEINTANLSVTNGAQIASGVVGTGTGGLVSINATDEISLDDGSIFANLRADATGNAGDIDITTTNLNLTNGSTIAAATLGIGDAGNITVNARESIFISGVIKNDRLSGIFTSALTVNGIAGDVDIFTNQLTIEDAAGISVSSSEGLAGNLSITANSLYQNGGFITSETRLNDEDIGANIDIQIAELWLLENESLVSATAFGIADGGNINIDTEFIVAFPNQNNDIIANAEQGIGGNINITAESLFGLAERSSTPPNSTNDIDASSEFGLDGDISIDTPDVDPARGLENLPTDIVDASRLITRTCLGGGDSDELNEFVVTGRGGIPSNPNESLPGDATLSAEWLTLPETPRNSRELPMREESSQSEKSMPQIVEAKGWLINADGNVVLTAAANTPQLSVPWLVPNVCHNS
ncbi:MAG: S-layer family protein, partial [Pleurocapsa sp. MO_192.B19]|nr:S-layer family protein [Pleurocapsa sp. MO_192.B19]